MQIKRFWVVLFAATLLLSSFVSASFSVDVNSSVIKKDYNLGDTISGSISISFNNESADSILSTNLGTGTITLGEWLKAAGKKESSSFNCSFAGCGSDYEAKAEASNVDISLQQSKLVGFRVSGSNISAKTFSFTVSSNVSNSCSKPYSINVLDTSNKVFENYRYTDQLCGSQLKGCFDNTLSDDRYQLANLTSAYSYCEKINLNPAPAYSFTANITKPSTAKYEEIYYDLYNEDFSRSLGTCTVAAGDTKCTIAYPVTSEDTYGVCISSNETNSAYQIRTEQSGQICGSANLGQTMSRDFDITAQALEYASTQVVFNNTKYSQFNNGENITTAIDQYLATEYGSDCAVQDCFIPLRLIGDGQRLTFTNPLLVYESDGVVITQNKLYEISKSPSTITSGKMSLSLDAANLNVSLRNTLLQILLGNGTILKAATTVSSIPISIEPTFALIAFATDFMVKTNLSVTSATWKFGDDGSTQSGLSVKHTFAKEGVYNVEVTAVTSNGTFTKSQSVLVGEPKTSAEELISSSERNIATLSSNLQSIPAWIKPGVDKKINIATLNNSLAAAKEKLAYAANDSEYMAIINEVQAIGIPESFGITRSGTFPLISAYQNINVDYLNALYDEEQTDPDQAKASLLEWTRDNYNGQIEISTYGAGNAEGNTPLLTKVKITLSPIGTSSSQKYLVIDYPLESIHFMTGYSEKELQSGTYVPVNGETTIEFYVEGETTIDSLGAYLAPSLAELQTEGYSYEVLPSASDKARPIIYISLIVLLVVIIGITIPLQYWYRNNYEKHLFPREESLFNVMTFIYNAKKGNLKEGDMRKSLLSNGWTREQISYALGKFEGKIFGIFGLPLYSARAEKKMKEDIENRQRQNMSRKVY